MTILSVAVASPNVEAQSLYGHNLVVNGDAESGQASDSGSNPVAGIPGWSRTGNADVVLWDQNGDLDTVDLAGPLTPGHNYLVGGPNNTSSGLSQVIDVSSGAAGIDAGTVVFEASAYLGGMSGDTATLVLTFQGAGGNTLSTVTLGPVADVDITTSDGMMWRRQIGQVPTGTRKVNVTITFNGQDESYNNGSADNLALILTVPGSESTVYGHNLLTNGDAESGPDSASGVSEVRDIPSWVRTGQFNVENYAARIDAGDFDTTSVFPPNRGNAYFSGGSGTDTSTGTQDLAVSAAAASIDAGKVTYSLSGYLGGYDGQEDNAVVTATFMNWSGSTLGQATIGPATAADRNGVSGFVQRTQSGTVPAGTRMIRVVQTMNRLEGSDNDGYSDNIVLTLTGPAASNAPTIGGIISLSDFGALPNVSAGSLIEIYGTNLSATSRKWSGSDFNGVHAPTSLDGVSVTVAGQAAFVNFISSGQVNVQVPDGIGTGLVPIVLKNSAGSSNAFTVTAVNTAAGMLAPGVFKIGGKQYVAAFVGPDYKSTFALPAGAISGVSSRAAKPGETVVIYGVGFGPVTPTIPSGTLPSGSNTLTNDLQVQFGGNPATVQYDGLSGDIVYQINVVVPAIADGDAIPLTFSLGGTPAAQTLYIAVHQ